MCHIKTNKTLHLTEILTLLKSFKNYLQSTEDKHRVFFAFQKQLILRPKFSNAFREPHCLSLFVVFTRWTDSANIGAGQPRLYAVSRAVWGFTNRLWNNQISWDPVCMSWSCNNARYYQKYYQEIKVDTICQLGQNHASPHRELK